MMAHVDSRVSLQDETIDMMLWALAAMVQADWGRPASQAGQYLRRSATLLGQLRAGDPERVFLMAWKWEACGTPPPSAERDRGELNQQIAELRPGWFA